MENKLFNQMVLGGAFDCYKKSNRLIIGLMSCINIGVPFILALVYLYSSEIGPGRIAETMGIVVITYFTLSFLFNSLLNSKYCAGNKKWKKMFLNEKKEELQNYLLMLDAQLVEFIENTEANREKYKKSIDEVDTYLNNSKTT